MNKIIYFMWINWEMKLKKNITLSEHFQNQIEKSQKESESKPLNCILIFSNKCPSWHKLYEVWFLFSTLAYLHKCRIWLENIYISLMFGVLFVCFFFFLLLFNCSFRHVYIICTPVVIYIKPC
jgi:prepilin signal peptidase PulO-like enzyme (type II secretory pathway)